MKQITKMNTRNIQSESVAAIACLSEKHQDIEQVINIIQKIGNLSKDQINELIFILSELKSQGSFQSDPSRSYQVLRSIGLI